MLLTSEGVSFSCLDLSGKCTDSFHDVGVDVDVGNDDFDEDVEGDDIDTDNGVVDCGNDVDADSGGQGDGHGDSDGDDGKAGVVMLFVI